MPTVSRRRVATGLAALAASAGIVRHATAQEVWPAKRITLMVGFASGGFADTVARTIARKLGEHWKQAVIVQNMPGAGGNIAARSVSMAAPDGYTLLATTTSLAINETLNKDKGFSIDALIPIAVPAEAPELLATNPKSGLRTMADVLQIARQGKLYMGSSGIGSGSHISAEYFFRNLAKVEVKHIPFPGGNPAKLALLTGDVNLMASTATVVSSIVSGELIGIAAGGAQRSPLLPGVPTYSELGYPGFTPSSWAGLFAPAGTPPEVLDAINAAVTEALKDEEVRKQFATMGLSTRTDSRQEVTGFFKSEVEKWGTMVKALGLQG
jgi:tripartite-type tricarboxylate transporter receptor subunit TctC